jgi:hypothetical protein
MQRQCGTENGHDSNLQFEKVKLTKPGLPKLAEVIPSFAGFNEFTGINIVKSNRKSV